MTCCEVKYPKKANAKALASEPDTGEKTFSKKRVQSTEGNVNRMAIQYQMVEDENSVYEYDLNCVNKTKR